MTEKTYGIENSYKKHLTAIWLCNNTQELVSASDAIKTAFENGELLIDEFNELKTDIKKLSLRCNVKTMEDFIEHEQKISGYFLLSLLNAIKRIEDQFIRTSFKDDELEMSCIFMKSIRELKGKIITAFHWDELPGNEPFFDNKQKRVCYFNKEILRLATVIYTDDNWCKGDAFFESKFFKQNLKPELAYIYVSLKNAKINECGFVVPR